MSQGRLIPDLDTRASLRRETDEAHVDFAEIPGCAPLSVWDFTTPAARRYNDSIRESVGEARGATTREGTATYIGGPFTADVTAVFESAGFERYDQINVVKVPTGFAMALCKSWNNRKTVRVHEHVVVLRRGVGDET